MFLSYLRGKNFIEFLLRSAINVKCFFCKTSSKKSLSFRETKFSKPQKGLKLLLSDYKIQLFLLNCSSQGLTSTVTACYKSYGMHNGSRENSVTVRGKRP